MSSRTHEWYVETQQSVRHVAHVYVRLEHGTVSRRTHVCYIDTWHFVHHITGGEAGVPVEVHIPRTHVVFCVMSQGENTASPWKWTFCSRRFVFMSQGEKKTSLWMCAYHVLTTFGVSQGEKKASPWMCTYHVLLAHAAAVKAFREHVPGGRISLNINGDWSQPLTNSPQDKVGKGLLKDQVIGYVIITKPSSPLLIP